MRTKRKNRKEHDWSCDSSVGYYRWRCWKCGKLDLYPNAKPDNSECPETFKAGAEEKKA